MIGGVLGGFAEYLEIDPTIIRLAFVLLIAISLAPGIIGFYLLAWIIIPIKREVAAEKSTASETKSDIADHTDKK